MKPIILIEDHAQKQSLSAHFRRLGLWGSWLQAGQDGKAAFAVDSHSQDVPVGILEDLPGVSMVLLPNSSHPKLDGLKGKGIRITDSLSIGGGNAPILAAGPCCAESRELVMATAKMVSEQGGRMLRGGAFKPRTSPYSFSGHGQDALLWLREAADKYNLALVTEVMSELDIDLVTEMADLIQIGSRNMQNFSLLRRVGKAGKPALLKRGRAASLSEWRMAAEYLLAGGASGVVFCERGILGSDPETRNTLDLAAVALLKHVDNLAVVVDPSHASGRRDLIIPLSHAAMAVGADGLLVETHPDASIAKSDGAQALSPQEFQILGESLGLSKP